MGAQSVTGTGAGASNKLTTKELSALANGPAVQIAGVVESTDSILSSPPTPGVNSVTFPRALTGGSENYIVLLTTLNGGLSYVTDMDEDANGNFSGFSFSTESECTLMYMVVKIGQRPNF